VTRRHRRGGRTTPKGTRPSHLRSVPADRPSDGPDDETEAAIIDDTIDGAADDLLAESDPLAVETWASGLLAMFDDVRRQARSAGMQVPPFERSLLERCAQRGDLAAMAVAAGLAAVAAPPLVELAAQVAHRLVGPDAPRWLREVGRSEPARAWRSTGELGAQESLIIEYARGTDRHALLVLVDHTMGGQAKDAWLAADPDEVLAAWRTDGLDLGLRIDEIPVVDALVRVRDAMAAADATPDDDVERSETYAEHRALVWSRVRRAGLPDSGSAPSRTRPVPTPPHTGSRGETRAGPEPVPTPSAAEAAASAAEALVLTRFDVLRQFYGDGRPLTKTGQVRLADARELVVALGTDDEIDPTIGTRTWRTRSAADLLELTFTVRWATTASALRRKGNRLIASEVWRDLAEDPLARWTLAAEALPELGPMATFMAVAHQRHRDPDEIIDELAPEILRTLLNGDVGFDDLLDGICRVADERYEWLAPYMKDPEFRRVSFDHDLTRLVRVLEWAGIATRTGASTAPDPYSRRRTRVVGGTVVLTTAGRWWLAGA
jgi:hypothetical protein